MCARVRQHAISFGAGALTLFQKPHSSPYEARVTNFTGQKIQTVSPTPAPSLSFVRICVAHDERCDLK